MNQSLFGIRTIPIAYMAYTRTQKTKLAHQKIKAVAIRSTRRFAKKSHINAHKANSPPQCRQGVKKR